MKISILARRRLYSTTYLDPYASAGFSPKLVFAPAADTYRTGGSATTFAGLVDYTGASNKTMVDSDGVLKWAPHNLLTYSEDFSNAAWVKTGATVSSSLVTITSSSSIALRQLTGTVPIQGQTYTFEIELKAGTLSTATVTILFSTGGLGITSTSPTMTADWQTFSVTATVPPGTVDVVRARLGGDVGTLYARNARVYRSDLGGVADNPDTGDSYVPTTSAARYLSRRNHHIYEGGEWVNAGMLVEPTAATNLITHSVPNAVNWFVIGGAAISAGPTVQGLTAATVTVASAGDGKVESPLINVTSGQTYTGYALLSKNSGSGWALLFFNGSVGTGATWFNLNTGAVGTVGTAGFGIVDLGGFYLCYISDVASATSTTRLRIEPCNGDNSSVAAAGDAIDVFGAQLEAGSVPSSYIPTAGSTATRAAETVSIAAAKVPFVNPDNLGPELVTNGTFDADTDWAKGTGWTIGGGVANAAGGTSDTFYLEQNSGLVAGKVYQYEFTTSGPLGGTNYFALRFGGAADDFSVTQAKTYSGLIVASGSGNLRVRSEASTSDITIDNISVREVTALELSIAMRGRMTYADTGLVSEVVPYQWSLDGGNLIYPQVYTVTTPDRFRFLQASSGVFEIIQANPSPYSPGINVPFSIASRHGSTFINGAVDGTALTADLTPTSLPNLSATPLQLAFSGGPMIIEQFTMFDTDLGDSGISEASS